MVDKKYNYIYKTTCTITGNFYIGMHSTNNPNDGYMGSGTILKRSINKYGKQNHIFEILEFLPDRNKLILREREIVNRNFIKIPECMNIMEGGKGGFISDEQQRRRAIGGAKARAALGYIHSEETKSKIKESNKNKDWSARESKEYRNMISQKTKKAMSKIDMVEMQKKAAIGRRLFWEKRHAETDPIILQLKEQGLKPKEIALILNITERTVYNRIKIYKVLLNTVDK